MDSDLSRGYRYATAWSPVFGNDWDTDDGDGDAYGHGYGHDRHGDIRRW